MKDNRGDIIEKYISLEDLRKVRGIGDKTIERVKEQLLQNELNDNYKSEYNPSIKLDVNEIHQGDCLELMNGIPDKSIDMILCDLPYGTTECKWDAVIPFDPLWGQYNRIIKENGAIVLFGQEPFSSYLRMSNIENFKYDWYWEKERLTNIAQVKKRAGKTVETISVFYKKQCTYNPQMQKYEGKKRTNKVKNGKLGELVDGGTKRVKEYKDTGWRYPTQVLSFKRDILTSNLHPTQKPLALVEFLVKTYSNEGETVLDNCIGSGTTGVACINLNRNFIGIELDDKYFEIAKQRTSEAQNTPEEEINKK